MKSLTQRTTAGVETLSVRAMLFSESPSVYNKTAPISLAGRTFECWSDAEQLKPSVFTDPQ